MCGDLVKNLFEFRVRFLHRVQSFFQSVIENRGEKLSEAAIYAYAPVIYRVLLVSRFKNRSYYSLAP